MLLVLFLPSHMKLHVQSLPISHRYNPFLLGFDLPVMFL